ncbi:MAG: hypothetical protein EA381_19220 [Planctomycetaceae bacterium]|nr:MAG: hypothetical protein EA381_19220 [Planctomycetaceae bacterium]
MLTVSAAPVGLAALLSILGGNANLLAQDSERVPTRLGIAQPVASAPGNAGGKGDVRGGKWLPSWSAPQQRVAQTPGPQTPRLPTPSASAGSGTADDRAREQLPRGAAAPVDPAAVSRLSGESIFGGVESLPRANDGGRIELPPIRAVTIATEKIGNGSLPEPSTGRVTAPGEPLAEQVENRYPGWGWSLYQFAAANNFSHPLYFEDVMLERHGHERFPLLQPFVSGGRFLATVPMLPYLMTVRAPWHHEYTLGHHRAGSRVYPFLQRPPYVQKAAIVEGLSIAGGAIAVP